MKRVIVLIILLAFPVMLFAVFEWNSESAVSDFEGGSENATITWDLTDLEIATENSYWFTQDGQQTNTAVLKPGVDNGKFIGLGTIEFNWKIRSLYGQTLSLYLGGPMTSPEGNELNWSLGWKSGTGEETIENILGGNGYGKEHAIEIAEHNPFTGGITTNGSVSIECRTGEILQTLFEDYFGYVYVYISNGGE